MKEQQHLEAQPIVLTAEQQKDQSDLSAIQSFELQEEHWEAERALESEEQHPVLAYRDMAEQLRSGEYDRSFFSRWKKKNSLELDEIVNSTKFLGNLLNMKISDQDNNEKIIGDIKTAYTQVRDACGRYLDSHEPKNAASRAKYGLVKTILEHVVSDMRDIDVNAKYFTETGAAAGATWSETLLGPRVIELRTGEKVHVQGGDKLGTGTSDIIVLHEGKVKSFVKRKEFVPDVDKRAVAAHVLHTYKKEIVELRKGSDGAFGGLTDEQRQEEIRKRMAQISLFGKIQHFMMNISEDPTADDFFDDSVGRQSAIRKAHELTPEEDEVLEALVKDLSRVALCSLMAKASGIPAGAELTKRNEATTVMADLLGISDMMMQSERVTLDLDGQKIEGLRMDEVKGQSSVKTFSQEEVLGKYARVTPDALKQFMCLQVFDIICGQMDRNEGNFMIEHSVDLAEKTLTVEKLVGIDNDMAFGTLSYHDIVHDKGFKSGRAVRKHANLEDTGGQIKLWAIDSEFAERILALSPAVLEVMMGRMLSTEERAALADRLKGVQQVILRMKKEDKKRADDEKRILSSQAQWQKMYEKKLQDFATARSMVSDLAAKIREAEDKWKAMPEGAEKDEYARVTLADLRKKRDAAKKLYDSAGEVSYSYLSRIFISDEVMDSFAGQGLTTQYEMDQLYVTRTLKGMFSEG